MADEEEKKERTEEKAEEGGKKSFIGRFLPWMIIGLVMIVSAVGGFGLGKMLAGPGEPPPGQTDPNAEKTPRPEDLSPGGGSSGDPDKVWYYDLDPVIANLNEPGVSRYVRASFTLEMSEETDKKKGTAFLDEKKPIMTDMLFVYLSGLSLNDVQGDKNLKSIQSRIRELFNERLFPDSKPQIKRVLIKEFPVQ